MTSGLENNLRVSYFQYDFAKHGGAVGAISVQGDGIPANAWIMDAKVRVNTAVVGTNSTVAIMAVGAGDVLAATAEASLTLNALIQGVPDMATVAHQFVLASAINALTFTVAAANLTAGKITVAVIWCLSA